MDEDDRELGQTANARTPGRRFEGCLQSTVVGYVGGSKLEPGVVGVVVVGAAVVVVREEMLEPSLSVFFVEHQRIELPLTNSSERDV